MSTWDRAAVWYDPHTQWQPRKLEVLNLLPLKVRSQLSCQGSTARKSPIRRRRSETDVPAAADRDRARSIVGLNYGD